MIDERIIALKVPATWSRAKEAAAWRWLSNAARKAAGPGVVRSRFDAARRVRRIVLESEEVRAAWWSELERRAGDYGYEGGWSLLIAPSVSEGLYQHGRDRALGKLTPATLLHFATFSLFGASRGDDPAGLDVKRGER